jgi:hypothetical protein
MAIHWLLKTGNSNLGSGRFPAYWIVEVDEQNVPNGLLSAIGVEK